VGVAPIEEGCVDWRVGIVDQVAQDPCPVHVLIA